MDPKAPIIPGGDFQNWEYFTLKEWHQLVIPTAEQLKNAKFLFTELQKLRNELDQPLYISSGIRTKEYTAYLRANKIPAALNSPHITGQAVDLKAPKGMTNKQFWYWCDKRWPGRMEKLAFTPTWVHLDTRDWGKRVRFVP